MDKLSPADIKDLVAYEKERPEFRKKIIALKQHRRVELGPRVTLVFENRDTIRFQVQEMVRAERIVDDKAIQDELDVYNPLIPEPNELSATLFIEVTQDKQIKAVMDRFIGIDSGKKVWFEFGGEVVPGIFEGGRSNEEKISAVHFVRFKFAPEQVRRFLSGEDEVRLVVRHGTYRHTVQLPRETHQSLSADFQA